MGGGGREARRGGGDRRGKRDHRASVHFLSGTLQDIQTGKCSREMSRVWSQNNCCILGQVPAN